MEYVPAHTRIYLGGDSTNRKSFFDNIESVFNAALKSRFAIQYEPE